MRPVDGEHSIEVIDLMLQQLGPVALEVGFMRPAAQVVIAHTNPVGTEDANEEVGEREAIIPHREVLVPDVDDLGIDEHPRLLHFDVHQAKWRADLRSRDAAPTPEARLPVAQCVGKVVHHDAHCRRLRIGNQLATLAQDGITQESNSADSHGAKVGPVWPTVNYPVTSVSGNGSCNALSIKAIWGFQRLVALPTVLLVIALTACSDSTGGGTPTSEISPAFSISAAPNGITFVFGRLEADGFVSVRLPDSDALVVSAAGQLKQMRWTVDPLGGGQYAASLTQLDGGTVVNIALSRGDDGNAPNSVVTMPPSLEISAPIAGTSATAGQDLLVSWAPSGTPNLMQVVMRTVVCDRTGAGNTIITTLVGDAGNATVQVDPSLLPPLASGEECEVDVQVQRVTEGMVDPAFAGGTFVARQLDVSRIIVLQP
jgi:hypothetical protein